MYVHRGGSKPQWWWANNKSRTHTHVVPTVVSLWICGLNAKINVAKSMDGIKLIANYLASNL